MSIRITKQPTPKTFLYTLLFPVILLQSGLLSASPVSPQSGGAAVTGYVRDADTGDPLMGVNVYLESTTYGFGSNRDGSFYIFRVPPGEYTLIASHIGYEPFTRQIRLTESEHETFEISLKPVVFGTDELVVTGRIPTEWLNKLNAMMNLQAS